MCAAATADVRHLKVESSSGSTRGPDRGVEVEDEGDDEDDARDARGLEEVVVGGERRRAGGAGSDGKVVGKSREGKSSSGMTSEATAGARDSYHSRRRPFVTTNAA